MSIYDVDYFRRHYKFKEVKNIFDKLGFQLEVVKMHVPILTLSKDGFYSSHDPYILKRLEANGVVEHIYLKHQKFYIQNRIQNIANG